MLLYCRARKSDGVTLRRLTRGRPLSTHCGHRRLRINVSEVDGWLIFGLIVLGSAALLAAGTRAMWAALPLGAVLLADSLRPGGGPDNPLPPIEGLLGAALVAMGAVYAAIRLRGRGT